jgi:hypothetical protein
LGTDDSGMPVMGLLLSSKNERMSCFSQDISAKQAHLDGTVKPCHNEPGMYETGRIIFEFKGVHVELFLVITNNGGLVTLPLPAV